MNRDNDQLEHVIQIDWSGWPDGVTGAVVKAAAALGSSQASSHLTIVVSAPPSDSAHRDCLREALRGLLHSSILEQPALRANLVFGGSNQDRQRTVEYLRDASFVFGATFDLGGGQ